MVNDAVLVAMRLVRFCSGCVGLFIVVILIEELSTTCSPMLMSNGIDCTVHNHLYTTTLVIDHAMAFSCLTSREYSGQQQPRK